MMDSFFLQNTTKNHVCFIPSVQAFVSTYLSVFILKDQVQDLRNMQQKYLAVAAIMDI